MTKKEIRNAAQQQILEGKNRQEVFEELLPVAKRPEEEVAKIVRFFPTLENRKKYKTAQGILIGLLVLSVLLKIFAGLPIAMQAGWWGIPLIFLIPLINIMLLIGVVTHRGESYRLVGIIGVLTVLRMTGSIGSLGWSILVDFAFAAALIGLGFFLNAKLVPDFELVKEKYTNAQGQARLRNKIRFKD